MTIKLTKNGNPILVNTQSVTNYETIHSHNRQLTKLFLTSGAYIVVEESLEQIYNIIWGMKNGVKQEVDWSYTTIDEVFEQNYQQPKQRRRIYQQPYNNSQW